MRLKVGGGHKHTIAPPPIQKVGGAHAPLATPPPRFLRQWIEKERERKRERERERERGGGERDLKHTD